MTKSPVAVYQLPTTDADAPDAALDAAYDAQRDRSLLKQNAAWFCQLRWIVIAVLAVAAAAALLPNLATSLGLRLGPIWPAAAAGVLAVANLLYMDQLRRIPDSATAGRIRLLLWCQIVLTDVIHFLGSRSAYAPFTYLFHIVLACVFFRRIESLLVTVISAVLYSACLALEYRGILASLDSFDSVVVEPTARHPWGWQLGSLFAIWMIIWYLVSRLATALRDRERELAATNRRLKASSEERARHMLQTTHQLKAPFAAIHANTQLLLGGYCGQLPAPSTAVVEKISSRSRMLSQQIQDMLQLANLRSEAQDRPRSTTLELADAVQAAVARMEPTASLRGIRFDLHLEPVQVCVVEDYLRMLLDNLLSNAVSYSYDGGLVGVVCQSGDAASANLIIRDQGIGISPDKISQVFQDYYRTKEAAQYNKASTGLGLAIVRHVARLLATSVTVESAPGWGTRFTVQMPAVRNDPVSRLAQQRSR